MACNLKIAIVISAMGGIKKTLYKEGRWGIVSTGKLMYNLKLREHTPLKIEGTHAPFKIESMHALLKI